MQMLLILFKNMGILALFAGAIWALLPGGFGLNNFNASHGPPITYLATMTWWLLMLSHPFAIYKIWSADQLNVLWWLLLPLLLHIVFFTIFGRDVGTG